ncbi:MAG: hypothetical protein ABSC38_06530 [Verrucomicrobiia bacterium]
MSISDKHHEVGQVHAMLAHLKAHLVNWWMEVDFYLTKDSQVCIVLRR